MTRTESYRNYQIVSLPESRHAVAVFHGTDTQRLGNAAWICLTAADAKAKIDRRTV